MDREKNLKDHIVRCKDDFLYFCKTELKIINKENRLQDFYPLKKGQLRLNEAYEKQKKYKKYVRIIVYKGRQVGSSTYWIAREFHETVFNHYFHSAIIAHIEDSTHNLFERLKMFYNYLSIKPERKRSNRKELLFQTADGKGLNSFIRVATAGSPEALRSQTMQFLLLSEVASFGDMESITNAAFNTVKDNTGTIVMESTSCGVGNYWHQSHDEPQTVMPDYERIFISWLDDEECQKPMSELWHNKYNRLRTLIKITKEDDENRYKSQLEALQKELDIVDYDIERIDKFDLSAAQYAWYQDVFKNKTVGITIEEKIDQRNQEYPLTPEESFIGSGTPTFDRIKLYEMKKSAKKGDKHTIALIANEIKVSKDNYGVIEIFAHPEPNSKYIIGIDSEEGVGQDNSSINIFLHLPETVIQVAKIGQKSLDPALCAEYAYLLAIYYNKALIVPEANNTGQVVVDRLLNYYRYSKIYQRESYDTITDHVIKTFGFKTTASTRDDILLTEIRIRLRENSIIIYSEETINELICMQKNQKGKHVAPRGKHDDEVIS
ncbi:MAG: hypothetical protein FJZ11_03870, partial [Candidatus Omnitrophica bacterium]|nr:hypothetical protein [Candidatus Omnitrophota bacterium]